MVSSGVLTAFCLLVSIVAVRIGWRTNRPIVNGILILASFAFVAIAGPWAVALLIASIILNYLALRALLSSKELSTGVRRVVLVAAIVSNVGAIILARFLAEVSTLSLIGASYYSMQQITVIIDAFEDPTRLSSLIRLRPYIAFVAFFPQITAGPISTLSDTYDYFLRPRQPSEHFTSAGFFLLARGIFFSVVVGASLHGMAMPMLSHCSEAPSLETAFGIVCTYLWLFFDFNGYSEIAMGSGLLLGVPLPQNFNKPVLAVTPAEFWARWHMSLTGLLKSYLFFPLVRGPLVRAPQLASVIVLFVISMWHGVTLSFLVFGLINGLSLTISQTQLGRRVFTGPLGWLLTQGSFALTTPLVFVPLMDCCALWAGLLTQEGVPESLYADITRGSKLAAFAAGIAGLFIVCLDKTAADTCKEFKPNLAKVAYTAALLTLSVIFYASGNQANVVYADF